MRTYRYEFGGMAYEDELVWEDGNGLPATAHTIALGVETDEPMVQTIVYKRVAAAE